MKGKGPPLLAHGAPVVTGRPRRRNVPSPHPSSLSKTAHKEPDGSFPALRRPSVCQKQRACGPRSSFPSRPLPMSFAHGTGILRALPAFFPAAPTLPLHRGALETRATCRATAPAHLSEKSALGGGMGAGGKEGPLRAGQGSLLPPKPATPALLPALAKAATDFYNHVLAGRPHGTQPCPAARGREGPS